MVGKVRGPEKALTSWHRPETGPCLPSRLTDETQAETLQVQVKLLGGGDPLQDRLAGCRVAEEPSPAHGKPQKHQVRDDERPVFPGDAGRVDRLCLSALWAAFM